MATSIVKEAFNTGRQVSRRLNSHPTSQVSNRNHIQLRGIPRTAVPADIRRLWAKAGLNEGVVSDVAIDYHRFLPSGNAWITLNDSAFLQDSLNALKGHFLGGQKVNAVPAKAPVSAPSRTRGTKGRAEAAERGITTGNGPHGGIQTTGQNVVIYGLPGRMSVGGLREYLKNFKLAGASTGEKEIAKLEMERFSLTSKHIVRMASTSEAHRLVRKLHQTYYEPETWNKRYPLRARVIY